MSLPNDDALKELQGDLIDAACGDQAAADVLLARHPELIGTKAHMGKTAMHFCIVESLLKGAAYLLERGADPNTFCNGGSTPLLDACILGSPDAVALLLRHGANPKLATKIGTPLQFARSGLELAKSQGASGEAEQACIELLLRATRQRNQ